MLRIGCVKYLNARPLIHGWSGEVVLNHPAALCARLARGDLDVALVSSFEFLRNPIYRIIDNISISSAGPVYSVVVAHRGEISETEEIDLDPASETSVNLLRCLLADAQLKPRLTSRSTSSGAEARVVTRRNNLRLGTAASTANTGWLLIGDQAVRFRQEYGNEFSYWDLGEQWQRIADLPFVYALWLIRSEVSDARTVAEQLRSLRDRNLAQIDNLIGQEKDFDSQFCRRYYHEYLRFKFGDNEKAGLREFYRRCIQLRILDQQHLELGAWNLEIARRCV